MGVRDRSKGFYFISKGQYLHFKTDDEKKETISKEDKSFDLLYFLEERLLETDDLITTHSYSYKELLFSLMDDLYTAIKKFSK